MKKHKLKTFLKAAELIIGLLLFIWGVPMLLKTGIFGSYLVAVFLLLFLYHLKKEFCMKRRFEDFGTLALLGGQIYDASFFKHSELEFFYDGKAYMGEFVCRRTLKEGVLIIENLNHLIDIDEVSWFMITGENVKNVTLQELSVNLDYSLKKIDFYLIGGNKIALKKGSAK